MLIVKIGGCNGSGKTSVVRSILDSYNFLPMGHGKCYEAVLQEHPKAEALSWHILGSYKNECGGMDTISNKEEVRALVEQHCVFNDTAKEQNGVTIFEGLITGKTYGYLGGLSEYPEQKGRWIYAFMDTPFDVCVERVLARRKAKGNDAPFDPERTMRSTYKACFSTAARAKAAGHPIYWIGHKLTPKQEAEKLIRAIYAYLKTGDLLGASRG